MSETYYDNKALILNRKNTNGLVSKPLYGFGLTLKPALASKQSLEYSGWSLGGRNSGHFRPLAAYTVTSQDIPEAIIMAKNHDCIAAGAAQDIEMPSQAAANGRSQLERASTVKTGPRGPKPVVVNTAYKTPISIVALPGSGPGGAAAYTRRSEKP
jgi:hypothetical protein